MSESTDPYLNQLGDQLDAARRAKVPDLREVRAAKDRLIVYIARCVLEEMDRCAEATVPRRPGQHLGVITNHRPVRCSPRGISSPMKTDEIRAFEARVNRVFGTDACATTEWPGDQSSSNTRIR